MKKHLLTCIFAAPLLLFAQQTYTWNGNSGSWTDPANWLPPRNAPQPDDILEFSSAAMITEMPATEAVGKLRLYNHAVVSINSAVPGTLSIGNTAVLSPHFEIEAGAKLQISGNNAITLSIGTGFSGEVWGNMDFYDGSHRLTALSSGALQFMEGSVFTANTGFDGNPFGVANLNSIIFESGAQYVNKAGGSPFGASAPGSVVIFKAGSIYTYKRNGVGSSLAGRSFGHLHIEGNVKFTGFGSAKDCTIRNDFRLISGFFEYKPNTNGTHSGNFNIYGDIICEDTTYIDIGSDNMSGAIQLLGSDQIIGSGGGTGAITIKNLTVNNTRTQLSRDITVTDTLSLIHGIINTSSSALLTLAPTSVIESCMHDYTNLPYSNIGCDDSHIAGPIQKLGLNNVDFAFPTGLNGKLRPVFLRNAAGSFIVEYKNADPYLNIGSVVGSGIHHISHIEYWTIEGSGAAGVELSFYDPNSGGVTDMNALRVAQFDGTSWENTMVSNYMGTPGANGSVTSSLLHQFGYFTLASSSNYPNNPLPLEITGWKAIANTKGIILQWQSAGQTADNGYIIEKKSGENGFQAASSLIPAKTSPPFHYGFTDSQPLPGENIYRIRIIDKEGRISYSNIINVFWTDNQDIIIYPNPAQEKIFIKVPPSSSIFTWLVVNINGTVVKRLNNNSLTVVCVDISNLSPGLYYIKGVQKQSPLVIPFIKVNFN